MNKTDLHSSLLFLMIKLEEAKSEQMADKNFVAALTEVLRYFRDNGELKKAYDLQKDSLTDIANSPWVKLVMVCRIDEKGKLLPKEQKRIRKVKQTLGIK